MCQDFCGFYICWDLLGFLSVRTSGALHLRGCLWRLHLWRLLGLLHLLGTLGFCKFGLAVVATIVVATVGSQLSLQLLLCNCWFEVMVATVVLPLLVCKCCCNCCFAWVVQLSFWNCCCDRCCTCCGNCCFATVVVASSVLQLLVCNCCFAIVVATVVVGIDVVAAVVLQLMFGILANCMCKTQLQHTIAKRICNANSQHTIEHTTAKHVCQT